MVNYIAAQKPNYFRLVEPFGPNCWAYGRAHGIVDGKSKTLMWRCPVIAVKGGAVELVDYNRCDFGPRLLEDPAENEKVKILEM